MSFFDKVQTNKITSLSFEAGQIASKFFQEKNFQIQKKPDGSEVTSADIAVSKFLREKLIQEFPQIPLICEEGDLRKFEGDVFWLIDPIDGTASFIEGSVEFAVSIALIKNKKAIFGLIYAPLFEGGKMIFSDEKNQIISRNFLEKDKILKATSHSLTRLRIITSARTKDADVINYITQIHPKFLQNFHVEKLSSAIKFFRLLESKADFYFHFRPSMEWDTAAGQALVELMGGKVKKLNCNQNKITIADDLDYAKATFENHQFHAFLSLNF